MCRSFVRDRRLLCRALASELDGTRRPRWDPPTSAPFGGFPNYHPNATGRPNPSTLHTISICCCGLHHSSRSRSSVQCSIDRSVPRQVTSHALDRKVLHRRRLAAHVSRREMAATTPWAKRSPRARPAHPGSCYLTADADAVRLHWRPVSRRAGQNLLNQSAFLAACVLLGLLRLSRGPWRG